MRTWRFWRNLWTAVGVAGVLIGLAALLLPEHGTGSKPYIALATVSLAIAAGSFIAAYQLMWAVRRFELLESGTQELARWWIDPPTWAAFVRADAERQAGLDRQWGENVLAIPPEIGAPVEVVVSQQAMRIGEAYHELDRDIMLGTRYMPGTPVMLEFYFKIIKPRGAPTPFIVRFPVEAGAEQKAKAALAHYNKPIAYGPIARALMVPGQAARRNPRKARNIALIVAAIGAALAAMAISQAEPPVARAWEQPDPGIDFVTLGVGLGAFLAIPALLVALVFHLRARRAA
ncbi:hypothetical protein sos41_09660 [Alphaproteobacteria bacterium SO-S41]|nr:hypothetical protein sos41_09660 [Alphaproteobacteria bacterium SO-S41]